MVVAAAGSEEEGQVVSRVQGEGGIEDTVRDGLDPPQNTVA